MATGNNSTKHAYTYILYALINRVALVRLISCFINTYRCCIAAKYARCAYFSLGVQLILLFAMRRSLLTRNLRHAFVAFSPSHFPSKI